MAAYTHIQRFLSHPLLWGVAAIVAMAIGHSGKISVTASTILMWVACAIATFGAYRGFVYFGFNSAWRGVSTFAAAIMFGIVTLLVVRWMNHAAVPIELSASIRGPRDLAISVENESDRVAKGITWELILYRESDLALFSYPTQDIGYVKAHSRSANYEMNLNAPSKFTDPTSAPQVKEGDVLIGSVSVDCPECKGVTYIIYLILGCIRLDL